MVLAITDRKGNISGRHACINLAGWIGVLLKGKGSFEGLAENVQPNVVPLDFKERTGFQKKVDGTATHLNSLIHRRLRSVDGDGEIAFKSNVRHVNGHGCAEHPGNSGRSEKEESSTFSYADHASADVDADVAGGNTNHGLSRGISDLLEGKNARQGLTQDVQLDIATRDPNVGSSGEIKGDIVRKGLMDRRHGIIDFQFENPAEGHLRNIDVNGSRDAAGDPGIRNNEYT